MKLDEELDRLYGLPLGEFTRARNELARELRNTGEREEADEVKSLPKPSVSAWAVNQLARSERMQIRSLVTASERLSKAQSELAGGRGSPDELREAAARQHEVLDALVASAGSVLAAADREASAATLERIRKTLTAVAADEDGRRLVETGRLVSDLDPAGFGLLAAQPAATKGRAARPRRAPAARKGAPDRAAEAKRKRIEEAQGKLEALEAEVEEQRQALKRAKEEAREAARAAKAADSAVDAEARELERLNARLEGAEDTLGRLRN